MRWVKEDTAFQVLSWQSPITSGILITLIVAENLARDDPTLFMFCYCAKVPFPSTISRDLVMYAVTVLCTILSLVSELCVHMTIHIKQSRIEDRAGVSVFEIKDNNCQAVWQQRNVVSAGLNILQSASISRSQGLLESFCASSFCNFFLLGCTAAVGWPNCLGNLNKNFLANLATELLTHSVCDVWHRWELLKLYLIDLV